MANDGEMDIHSYASLRFYSNDSVTVKDERGQVNMFPSDSVF